MSSDVEESGEAQPTANNARVRLRQEADFRVLFMGKLGVRAGTEAMVSHLQPHGYRLLDDSQGKNVAAPEEARYALLGTDVRDSKKCPKVFDGLRLGGPKFGPNRPR